MSKNYIRNLNWFNTNKNKIFTSLTCLNLAGFCYNWQMKKIFFSPKDIGIFSYLSISPVCLSYLGSKIPNLKVKVCFHICPFLPPASHLGSKIPNRVVKYIYTVHLIHTSHSEKYQTLIWSILAENANGGHIHMCQCHVVSCFKSEETQNSHLISCFVSGNILRDTYFS